MAKQIDNCKKPLIIDNYKNKFSLRQISECREVPKSTVYNIIKKFKSFNRLERLPGSGRSCILSDAHKEYLLDVYDKNHFLTYVEMSKMLTENYEIKVHEDTIRNFLLKKRYFVLEQLINHY